MTSQDAAGGSSALTVCNLEQPLPHKLVLSLGLQLPSFRHLRFHSLAVFNCLADKDLTLNMYEPFLY